MARPPSIPGWSIERRWRTTDYADHFIATRPSAGGEAPERAFLRVLRPMLGTEPEAILRHGREVRLLAGFRHEGVLPVVASGLTESGDPWLATEWRDGRLLRAVLDAGPVRWRDAVRIATRVAEVLGAAHDVGYVHRDLRPAHVLVGRDGHVWVLDFDQVHHDDGLGDITDLNRRVGSVPYMSPEYIERHHLDARSDLYALGVLLYELATGTLPFQGTDAEVCIAHVTQPVPDHPRLDTTPGGFRDLVRRLLAKNPDDRPGSATSAAAELRAVGRIPRRANSLPPGTTSPLASLGG